MIDHFGKGAVKRPEHLKTKDKVFGAVPPFDFSQVKEDTIGNISGLFGIKDRDQGQSESCTAQATGYGFAYTTGIEISREDLYSNTRLAPAGGAFLNAPLDFLRNKGYLPQTKFPDPSPETEANMSQKITVKVGDRIRTFQLTYTYYPDNTIDSAAYAITQHDYIHLGIDGNNHGWQNELDPIWEGVADWGHALMAGKDSIVLRHGVPAIKARSSWCSTGIYCHYLTKNYFPGVFEIIGVDLKEIEMQLVNDNGTYYLVGDKGKLGIADPDALAMFKLLTSTEQTGTTAGVPEVKVIKKGFIIE